MKKTSKKMISDNLVSRLIHTYPDSISYTDEGDLDFESTVYNFAVNIVDEMPESQQKSALGQIFKSYEDMYTYLIIYYDSLREQLERQINNKEDGD